MKTKEEFEKEYFEIHVPEITQLEEAVEEMKEQTRKSIGYQFAYGVFTFRKTLERVYKHLGVELDDGEREDERTDSGDFEEEERQSDSDSVEWGEIHMGTRNEDEATEEVMKKEIGSREEQTNV